MPQPQHTFKRNQNQKQKKKVPLPIPRRPLQVESYLFQEDLLIKHLLEWWLLKQYIFQGISKNLLPIVLPS